MKYKFFRPRRIIAVLTVACLAALAGWFTLAHDGIESFQLPDRNRFAYSGPSFELEKSVVLNHSPRLVLRRGTIRLRPENNFLFGLLGSSKGDSAGITSGEAPLELEGGRLILVLSQQSKKSKKAEPGTREASDQLLTALSQLNFGSLALRNCSLTIKRSASNDSFDGLNALLTKDSDTESVSIEGSARFRGQTLAFDASIRPAASPNDGKHRIGGTVRSELLSASFAGLLDTQESISLAADKTELTVTKLRAAARWLGQPWPRGEGLREFQAQGPMTWKDGRLSFEKAQFSIDGSAGSGALSISLTSGSPVIEGTVAFETLEIAPYLNLKAKDQQQMLLSGIFPAIADTRTTPPQSIITEVNADLRISAEKLTVNGTHVGRGAATLEVKERVMRANFAEVVLENGGTGNANLQIDMKSSTPQVSLHGKLSDIDIGNALRSISGHTVLEGQGTIDAGLSGQGYSSREIFASLNGDLAIAIPAGGTLTVDIAGTWERATGTPLQGWDKTLSANTPLENMSAKFKAKDGTFTALGLEATSPKGALALSGIIRPSVNSVEIAIGETPVDVEGQTAPTQKWIQVRGPWLEPEIRQLEPKKEPAPPGDSNSP